MSELKLHPFATRVRWQRRATAEMSHEASGETSVGTSDWGTVLGCFAAAIATEVRRAGARTIGHIKGIACGPGQTLRVNCVSERIAAEVQGKLPADVSEFELDLVVLAHGLAPAPARAAVEAALTQTCARHSCTGILLAAYPGREHR